MSVSTGAWQGSRLLPGEAFSPARPELHAIKAGPVAVCAAWWAPDRSPLLGGPEPGPAAWSGAREVGLAVKHA